MSRVYDHGLPYLRVERIAQDCDCGEYSKESDIEDEESYGEPV